MDGGYTMEEKILIIIPAYNEEESILNTYKTILEYNKSHTRQLSTIVINDGSKDRTEKILQENKIPHIQLVHNLGIGGAVQTGYKYAYENDFDIAIQFDGDGQHDISFVDALVAPIENGNINMTIGSRFVEGSTSEFKSTKARQMGIIIISSFIYFWEYGMCLFLVFFKKILLLIMFIIIKYLVMFLYKINTSIIIS